MAKVYRILAKKATPTALLVAVFILAATPALARVPNDPYYQEQALVWNQIDAPKAWDYSTGSSKVVVAVIDTGVDTWHPDLSKNIWTNTKEIPDNGVDDDTNGFIDDVHGWNFVEGNNDPRTSVFDEGDDKESVSHGTIISGLIGERGDNGIDGTGLNWQVSIMPIRAITNAGTGVLSNVTRAVNYAIENGANVITMSFVGKYDEPTLRGELYRAYQKGIVVVAAAGNHDETVIGDLSTVPEYPACYDRGQTQNWLLTVASVNMYDQVSYFSNTGNCIDIAAPGESIFSTQRYAPQYGYPEQFGGAWDGTSFAAPIVAGAAALLKAAHPDWKPDQIISTLISTADSIAAKNTHSISFGRLNVGKAMSGVALAVATAQSGSIYTVDGKVIRQLDVGNQKITDAATISGAKIISAAALPGSGQLAVLTTRQKVFSIQVYDLDGRLDREITLPVTEQKGVIVKRLHVMNGDGYLLEQFTVKNNQTTFTLFNRYGIKLKEARVQGSVLASEASANNQIIAYATLSKNTLLVRQYNFVDNTTKSASFSNVQAINALTIGVWGEGRGEEVAAIIKRNGTAYQVVVNVENQSYSLDSVGAWNDKERILIRRASSLPSGRDALVRFKSKGGASTLVNGRGEKLASFTLPPLSGVIQ